MQFDVGILPRYLYFISYHPHFLQIQIISVQKPMGKWEIMGEIRGKSWLLGGFKHEWIIFHFIYGMSSETHWRTPSFFKMVKINHQPAIVILVFTTYFSLLKSSLQSGIGFFAHTEERTLKLTRWACWYGSPLHYLDVKKPSLIRLRNGKTYE